MKNLLTSISIIALLTSLTGCKKDADIDPRDQYVGIYSMTTTTTRAGTALGNIYTVNPKTEIFVTKDPNSKQLRIVVPINGDLLATLDGSAFTIPQQSTTEWGGSGQSYPQYYQGDGLFSGSNLNFNFIVDAKSDQATTRTVITLKGIKTGNI